MNQQNTYNKYVRTNTRDLELAIREGLRPMLEFYDSRNNGTPFFEIFVSPPEKLGNAHNLSYSLAHVPGRWLNALLNTEEVLGLTVPAEAIDKLTHCVYTSMESEKMGLPACIDLDTMKTIRMSDLHNLRETMHAFYALVKYRNDPHALNLAIEMIDTIDEYYDYNSAKFDVEQYYKTRNATLLCADTHFNVINFPICFGRYIGPLVKLYKTCGCTKALEQAIKLKNTCFKFILDEAGSYNHALFGSHTHSVTAMISSLAQLGDVTGDMEIFRRVKAFMENGLGSIATDFGWCCENYCTSTLYGEINNTSDIMETCLILAKHGFPGYYARAERILRGHFLPSQLLDTGFVPELTDPEHESTYKLASRAVGAFGFPCPFGHEYKSGDSISFNWDVVGGAVGGLCEAFREKVTYNGYLASINLLFDHKDDRLEVSNPYSNNNRMDIHLKKCSSLRVRIPGNIEHPSIKAEGCSYIIDGEWMYLNGVHKGDKLAISFNPTTTIKKYQFRDKSFRLQWCGEEVTAADSAGKRLCFFPQLDV